MAKSAFSCPQCGSGYISRIQETGTNKLMRYIKDYQGEIIGFEIDTDAIPQEHYRQYYKCASCKYILKDENGKIIDDHPKFKRWIKKYCKKE